MFRPFLFVFVIIIVTLVYADKQACKELGLSRLYENCCKQKLNYVDKMKEIQLRNECAEHMKPPPNCDFDICMAKKSNIEGPKPGTIDKEKTEAFFRSLLQEYPVLAEKIVKECINGDLNLYGPPDLCDVLKYKQCSFYQIIAYCPEWDDAGECVGVKDIVNKCLE